MNSYVEQLCCCLKDSDASPVIDWNSVVNRINSYQPLEVTAKTVIEIEEEEFKEVLLDETPDPPKISPKKKEKEKQKQPKEKERERERKEKPKQKHQEQKAKHKGKRVAGGSVFFCGHVQNHVMIEKLYFANRLGHFSKSSPFYHDFFPAKAFMKRFGKRIRKENTDHPAFASTPETTEESSEPDQQPPPQKRGFKQFEERVRGKK